MENDLASSCLAMYVKNGFSTASCLPRNRKDVFSHDSMLHRAACFFFLQTMNTASRMESNSMPRRIQVSKETADLLVQGGKGSWLKEREDPIQAKGKGELRTFWLVSSSSSRQNGNDPARRGSSRSSSHRSSLSDTEDYDITTFHEDDEDTAIKVELSSRLFEKRLSV